MYTGASMIPTVAQTVLERRVVLTFYLFVGMVKCNGLFCMHITRYFTVYNTIDRMYNNNDVYLIYIIGLVPRSCST